MLKRRLSAIIGLNFCLSLYFASPSLGQDRTFGGYECSADCSGHAAGYRWAERNRIRNASQCPLRGRAISFYEGCLAYVEDPYRGADEDDDGEEIED